MSDLSDLDNLLAELDHIEAPKKSSSNYTPTPAPAPPKATPSVQPTRASATVASTPKATASKADWDELDALVAKFETAPPKADNNRPVTKPVSNNFSNSSSSSSNNYSSPAPPKADNNRPVTKPVSNNFSNSSSSSSNNYSKPAETKSRQPTMNNNNSSKYSTPSSEPLDLNSLPSADDYDSKPTNYSSSSNSKYSPSVDNDENRRATITMMAGPSSSEVCHECGQLVTGEHMMAMGKKWHMDHFRCSDCRSTVSGDYYEYDSQPKCRSCFETKYVCSKCGKAISGEYYTGGGKLLHSACIDRHRVIHLIYIFF
jgi:hypothetical protein